jgi:AcrR family transcriptional regulator
MLVSAPESSIQAVADKAGVTTATIRNWFKDPEFVEVYYQKHSGKLIKRVEVDNHQSPFEKFLNTQVPVEAEIIEDIEEVQVFPQRPIVPENPVQIKLDEKKKAKKNKKRREARRWRERAEAVGVEMPKQGRQTPRQRKEWQEKVEKREKALNIKVL